MPHCTNNFAWYLGKFLAGFTGMLFVYVVFLKEKEYSCLCGPRMREFVRRKGEKRSSRCGCKTGPRSILAAAENLWTWYTRIKEWIHQNDPAIVSETVLALGRGLPKNDNDISSINCMCCLTMLNRKPKETPNQGTESTTSVRGKRSAGRHCLFRHCSGIVCADKLAKRRRNKLHRVHLRLSEDIVSDYWKICKDNRNFTSLRDIAGDDAQIRGEVSSNTAEYVNATHEREENEYCKELGANVKSVEKEANANVVPPMDIKYAEEETAPKMDDKVEYFSDWNVCKMCAQVSTAKSSPRPVAEANIFGDICGDDSAKGIAEDVTDVQRMKIPFDETRIKDVDTDVQNYPSGTIKKHSQCDSSLNDTIIKGHCMDSVLYRELRTKCAPATEKRLPANHAKVGRSAEISSVKSRREFDSNLKHSVNKLRSTSRVQKREIESSCPAAWQKGTTNQKKLFKFPCENCFCDTKTCRNNSPWGSARKDSSLKFNPCFVQPQRRILATSSRSKKNARQRDSVRSRKSTDSAFDRKLTLAYETRCAKYKPQLAQCKEKPTVVIYKNKRSNVSREEMRCEYSTHSAYSSTSSTEFTESSLGGNNLVACRCPSYRSSCCTTTTTDRYKHSRYNTRVARNSLLSSSSSLSSFYRRHRHWAMLSQGSLRQERKPISSFCTNVQACMKRCSRNKRTSTYPSSTSSSSSLMSLSTFKEDLDITNTDQTIYQHASTRDDDRLFGEEAGSFEESNKCQGLWKGLKYREQGKKRTVYTDEHHVTWNIKHPC